MEFVDDIVKIYCDGEYFAIDRSYLFLFYENGFFSIKSGRKSKKYLWLCIDGAPVAYHRYIMNATQTDVFVDHINRNTYDCTKNNFRLCSNKENLRNSQIRKSKLGFKGAFAINNSKKFGATIWNKDKREWIGSFDTLLEAASAYDKRASELFGEFAGLNFPTHRELNFEKLQFVPICKPNYKTIKSKLRIMGIISKTAKAKTEFDRILRQRERNSGKSANYEMAFVAGKTAEMIRQYRIGSAQPRTDVAEKLATHLEVPMQGLFAKLNSKKKSLSEAKGAKK